METENEKIREYCREALEISGQQGAQNALSFLIGEKLQRSFSQLKKARQKLRFLYPGEEASENHPLDKGGRALKMSYALAIQEHYGAALEQARHSELFLKEFVSAVKNSFSADDIRSYFQSSPRLDPGGQKQSGPEMDCADVLREAEAILALEDIKKLFF